MEEWIADQLDSRNSPAKLCMLAMDKEKVAGFNLIALGEVSIPLIDRVRKLRPDAAWSEQISAHRDYRKRGLGSSLRYHVFDELKQRGFKKLYGGALVNNIASLKLAGKTGFTVLADVHYRKLFNSRKWTWKRIRQ